MGKRLIAALVIAFLTPCLGQTAAAQTTVGTSSTSSASDQSVRLARLEQQAADAKSSADIAWMLTSSALVLMMTGPGLALFYSGLVRRKNVLGTMMQSFAMMVLITLQWFLFGYSIAFHEGSGWGGLSWMFLGGVSPAQPDPYGYAATIPHQLWMVYQLMFAI